MPYQKGKIIGPIAYQKAEKDTLPSGMSLYNIHLPYKLPRVSYPHPPQAKVVVVTAEAAAAAPVVVALVISKLYIILLTRSRE